MLGKEKNKYNVILYTNSEMSPSPLVHHNAKELIHFPVDDIDHYEYHSLTAPTPKDIKNALISSEDKENLICACHAGVSRSSATAYLVGSKKWGPEAGLDVLQKDKHFPNRLIVWIGSKILNLPAIWDKFVEWQKHHRHLDPSQNGNWPPASLVNKIVF
jgi:predicted protein tyrosine phosphatase